MRSMVKKKTDALNGGHCEMLNSLKELIIAIKYIIQKWRTQESFCEARCSQFIQISYTLKFGRTNARRGLQQEKAKERAQK